MLPASCLQLKRNIAKHMPFPALSTNDLGTRDSHEHLANRESASPPPGCCGWACDFFRVLNSAEHLRSYARAGRTAESSLAMIERQRTLPALGLLFLKRTWASCIGRPVQATLCKRKFLQSHPPVKCISYSSLKVRNEYTSSPRVVSGSIRKPKQQLILMRPVQDNQQVRHPKKIEGLAPGDGMLHPSSC